MTDAPSVSEDLGTTVAPTPYDAPLDLATTLSRPRTSFDRAQKRSSE
jgi:hypothetical protein